MKAKLAGKAAKTAAKHTARRTAAKLRREPIRASTLLTLGCALGVLVGWVAARQSSAPTPQP